MVLLIDNYDSFVYNLARYFEELGQVTRVVRNDAIDVEAIRAAKPTALVISPGPCTPDSAGVSIDAIRELAGEIPILGVCLGHQAIGAAYGARIVRARPMHGRTSKILHRQSDIFRGLPTPLEAARYHSLVIDPDSMPTCLEVTAWTGERGDERSCIMGIRHRELPVTGVQFHPESVLTRGGHRLLENFLKETTADLPVRESKTA